MIQETGHESVFSRAISVWEKFDVHGILDLKLEEQYDISMKCSVWSYNSLV